MNANDLMVLIVTVQQDLAATMKRDNQSDELITATLADLTVTRTWNANGLDFVAMTCPNVDPGPEIAYWLDESGNLRAVEVIDESEEDMETIRDQYITRNAVV